jgi:hypothetical protein
MTEQLLFPRLNDIGVQQLLPAEGKFDAANLDLQIESAPPFISWAATGGRRIKASELLAIRSSILKIAASLGFPRGSTQAQRADFDAECSVFLLEGGIMPTGEALRDDVWAQASASVVMIATRCAVTPNRGASYRFQAVTCY